MRRPADGVAVVLVRGDRRQVAQLRVVGDAPYRLHLEGAGRLREAEGGTLFEALVGLRLQLEADGWLPAVAGARRDAYPATEDGTKVWTHGMGRRPRRGDAVDVLSPVDDIRLLATVDEQVKAQRGR